MLSEHTIRKHLLVFVEINPNFDGVCNYWHMITTDQELKKLQQVEIFLEVKKSSLEIRFLMFTLQN